VADKLKNFFNEQIVRTIAADLRAAHAPFDERGFVRACLTGLGDLELLARGWHVAEAMHQHLPQPFSKAADVLVRSFGPELASSETFGLEPLRYMPHVFYIAKYGLDDLEVSLAAQYEVTKRFSAEFSIRAFLEKYPEETHARLQAWATDANVHVRRLVSEGTRPRLPWAPRLRAFQKDPTPVLRLLDRLKDDPERYVQRSVANNLNDIGKDHPGLLVDVCRRWSKAAPPGRAWIIRHALRSLVKRGDAGALRVLGFASAPKIKVSAVQLSPARVRVGNTLRFSFALTSRSKTSQELLVDYAVHFVKANGAQKPKVFKLKKLVLLPAEKVALEGKVSFASMTTRRHYSGRHQIDVIVNGVLFRLGTFDVRAP
jgi:3-methyladenine DNA glycosylase AlkC